MNTPSEVIFKEEEEAFVPPNDTEFVKCQIEDTKEEFSGNYVEPPTAEEIVRLKLHITTPIYNGRGNFTSSFACLLCDRKLATKSGLKRHIDEIHKKLKPYKCNQCPFTTTRSSQLCIHKRSIHEKSYKCTVCDYIGISRLFLARHSYVEHEIPLKPYTCNGCSVTFSTKENLRRHISNFHQNTNTFHCEECPYECLTKNILNHHKKTVHEKFKCYRCDYKCSTLAKLNEHRDSEYAKIKKFSCTMLNCTFTTLTKTVLDYHVTQSHG